MLLAFVQRFLNSVLVCSSIPIVPSVAAELIISIFVISWVNISRSYIICDSISWFNSSWVCIIWVSISWLNKLPGSEFVDQSQFSFGQSNGSVVFTLELKSDIIIERVVLLPTRDTSCYFSAVSLELYKYLLYNACCNFNWIHFSDLN